MLLDRETEATPREVRVFGLLWLLFFAVLASIVLGRPRALVGAGTILALAWVVSLIFDPARARHRLIGALLPALFALAGGATLAGVPRRAAAMGLVGAGVLGALLVWAAPGFGRRLLRFWTGASEPLGWTLSHLILGLIYYWVLTPIGLLLRAAGRDPMHRRFEPTWPSYWIERRPNRERSRYFRQF